MNDIESLRRLTETVETAGADIAPTYIEYVQLAFAIATDCGEAGRDYFHRLCRLSAKYQREQADRVFSNALATKHGDIHPADEIQNVTESINRAMQYVEMVYTPTTDIAARTTAKGVDGSGKDLVRACFLSHDPEALFRNI